MFCRSALLLILFTVSLGCSTAASSSTGSSPAFWEVRKGESTVFLMGSMHFGRPDFYPLPGSIEEAFINSARLVVEVNLLGLRSDAPQIIFKHAGLPPRTTLKDVLSATTYELLQERAELNKVPFSAFQRFQPWYVTLMLVEAEIRKTSLQQQLGVDLYFLRRGQSLGKAIEELETFDSQLSLFSGFSFEDQERFLRQTLDDLQNGQSYLSSMADAWVVGDVDLLAKTLIEPFRAQKDTRVLFETMFTRRNIKMAASVDNYLKLGGNTFLVVGIGHMVGSDGIVELLRSKGLTVRRLTPAPTESKSAEQ
ncbi:MAG: TraB/GumN family protein [Cellvibrionaceae bacterium]|nr:TraB/GumN family protein [Cellvibrionaceae bacterium]